MKHLKYLSLGSLILAGSFGPLTLSLWFNNGSWMVLYLFAVAYVIGEFYCDFR